MPYVKLWVDADEVLSDVSVDEMKAELLQREKKRRGSSNPDDYRIPRIAARQALDDASRVLRKQGCTDLAFKLDEIREDYMP